MTAPTPTAPSSTAKTNPLRQRLLIGASIGAMLFTGVAEAQDRSGGGRVFSGRGGGDPTAAAARAAQDQATRANETNSATQRAITAFRRAAETRQAMNDAQAAARALARATHVTVPNGMGPGGLQVANGVELDPSLWVGANRPVQSEGENGRTNVSIEQTQQRAILNWDSFNVGRETDLSFNQGGADWVALNRVVGNSANPSQILGSIKAQGTVLILNQNGVIFGGASQVNVRNLIASSASISNEQFLNRGIYSPLSGSDYLAAFTNARGAVTVEAGAQIITNTPASVTSGGGYVLLMGTEVRNDGTIITPRGQTVLSAGDDFIIRRGYGTEENPYSTTRGNEVRGLINAGSTSGTVTNAGLIEAAQGDITLAGRTIRQDGVALATTSVNQRGTIHLLNSASDGQGSVTLGKDSLTVVLPELESDDTALNSQRDALIAQSNTANLNRHTTTGGGFDDRSLLADRLDQSRIEIVTGGNVTFEGGSQTMAQGGQVAVQAGAGRITVEDGARIDVSGVMGVALNMADNSIQVNIQGNELRDSPANRDSDNLKNQNVWIDVRDLILLPDGTGGYDGDRWYTPGGLLEVGGHLANMSHGIGEWAAVGGTITLSASEIVAQQGAVFDLSGGSLDYRSGYIRSTRVMGADGRMYDIRNAPAHLQIVAVGNAFIRRHDRWGDMYTEVYSDPLFSRGTSQRWEDGYTVGRDAGRLILSAPTVVFDGDIVSEVINGERQVNARANGVADGYKLGQHTVARGGALTVANVNAMGFDTPNSSRIVIGDIDAAGVETGEQIPAERQGSVLLDADRLTGYGLGEITLVTDGGIAIEGGLTLADGGELNLVSGNIAIGADVTIRSGTVTATNRATIDGVSGTGDAILLGDGNPAFRLGDGATIDLSGIWSNARIASGEPLALAHVDGGSLSVRMVEGSVRLEAGSTVDLSSGAALLDNGTLMGGRGGDLTLIANEDRSAVPGGVDIDRTGKELLLDGVIRAQGVVGGGTLTLQSPSPVLFGENALLESGVLGAGVELPADVILSEAITIVPGARLPVGMTTRLSSLPPGVPSQGHSSFEAVMAADDWTVPAEFSNGVYFDGGFAMPGDVIPAGSMVSLYTIPRGVVLPAAVFPDGIPVAPFDLALAAGDIAPIELVIPAGKVLARGTVFDQDILFGAASRFDASLLRSGFSQYDITSRAGLVVAPGTDLTVETPVLRARDAAFTAATGTRPQDILESWMPPQFLENPETGRLTPRAGASLSLHGASLEIGRDARIAVDPGHSVDLVSTRQMIVDGAIIAPGGDISLRSEPLPTETGNLSIWIGESATLDAAGRSWTARDARGLRYGIAQSGGSIRIGLPNYDRVAEDLLNASRAAVVIREGAVLDASGASATIDIGMGPLDAARTVQLAGNGGLIQIGSMVGIVNDGTMRAAAGGVGAAGGRLNLVLENQVLAPRAVRTLTVSQDRVASGMPSEARPGDRLSDGLL
ncbi:filamentous hemagglutinin family N-terminal domain-containing protein, partial [Sphingomonas laterariae]